MRAATIIRAAVSVLPLTLVSCRAMESRCSDAAVVNTVKALSGESSGNPVLSKLLAALHTTFSVDAIRTISSSSRENVCAARLTVRFQVPQDAGQTPSPTGRPETAAEHEVREQMMAQLAKRVHEITYKVKLTDDGQSYVTIVPPDADGRSQDMQQQEQQLDQHRRDDAERQREYQQEQDNQRTQEWEQRQQLLEQQAPRE